MGFNLDEIRQALKQQKPYIWNSYTSSKPNTSNLVGKSDVAFGNAPQQSADSISDDFWRLSKESDANYYESRGYKFDDTKWNKPGIISSDKFRQDFENNTDFADTSGVQGWLNMNGYNAGAVDGLHGKNTQAALNRALADSNVSEDIKNKLRTYQNNATFVPTRQRSAGVQPQRSTGVQQQTPSSTVTTTPTQKNTIRNANKTYYVSYKRQNVNNSPEEQQRVSREEASLLQNPRFRKHYDGSRTVYINGKAMPVVVTQGSLGGNHNDRSFAYDSTSKHFIPLEEDFAGHVSGKPMLNDKGKMFYYSQDWILNNTMANGHSYKNGGSLNKYQQGGSMNNTEEMQRAFMAFLIEDASTQGITIQSEEDLVKYTEALGEEGIKAKYQEFIKKMQGGIKAKYGAKLTQVRKLKGLCADDEELVYLKQGGRVCPVCQKKMKKAQEGAKVKKNVIEKFKESRKIK